MVYLNIKRTGETKKTQRLVIQNGKITQEGATTVEDSGDENTLIKALVWAVTEYPSDHLVVDLWNHGSGPLNRNMLEMLALAAFAMMIPPAIIFLILNINMLLMWSLTNIYTARKLISSHLMHVLWLI